MRFARMKQSALELAGEHLVAALPPMPLVGLLGCAEQSEVTATAPARVGPDLVGPAGRTVHFVRLFGCHLPVRLCGQSPDRLGGPPRRIALPGRRKSALRHASCK